MSEFDILEQSDVIGNYKSAKLLLVTLHERNTKKNTLIFARICLQITEITQPDPQTIFKNLNNDFGFGIIQYDIEINTAKTIYERLEVDGIWLDPKGHSLVLDRNLKQLTRKFTGPDLSYRENEFLANTANGSHWIEFFNERKRTVQLVYDPYRDGLLEKMAPTVKQYCQIDLEKVRDRIGNIIVQFPVTIVEISLETKYFGNKVALEFDWKLPAENIPEIYIHTIFVEENSVVQFDTQHCNNRVIQEINIRSYDNGLRIYIYRKNPELIIFEWRCPFSSITGIYATFTDELPTIRTFYIDDQPHSVTLHFPNGAFNALQHSVHSKMAIDRLRSKKSYRQFEAGKHEEAVLYLRNLVQQSRAKEILIIDPYLTSNDILNVLYFSTLYARSLRAIGSATAEAPLSSADPASPPQETSMASNIKALLKIKEQRAILYDPRNSNLGITLEFRMQYGSHGIPMHDRFILFPGNPDEQIPPVAYSIGTSFNGVGKSYHLIGAIEGPQNIIDDFEQQWKMLETPDCLVYKCIAKPHELK